MAEYREIVEQFERMCEHYENCDGCPLRPIGKVSEEKDRSGCMEWSFKSPSVFQHKVMKWAEEHPEPVYPAWIEWLKSMGVVPYTTELVVTRGADDGHFHDGRVNITAKALEAIPADIAQKLNIRPVEKA